MHSSQQTATWISALRSTVRKQLAVCSFHLACVTWCVCVPVPYGPCIMFGVHGRNDRLSSWVPAVASRLTSPSLVSLPFFFFSNFLSFLHFILLSVFPLYFPLSSFVISSSSAIPYYFSLYFLFITQLFFSLCFPLFFTSFFLLSSPCYSFLLFYLAFSSVLLTVIRLVFIFSFLCRILSCQLAVKERLKEAVTLRVEAQDSLECNANRIVFNVM